MKNDIYNGSSEGFNFLLDGYMDYSKEVIARRAIPDLRDGLKPVQRRILYSAKLADKGELQKCVTFVSNAMKYHAHGDSSVWSAMSLLTDVNGSWNAPVIKGMGNFGRVESKAPPAAYRYPKAMLHPNADEYFKEKDVFEMIQSEEGDGVEPVVLYPSYPAILVNGTAGIAVSVGTRIPSFNMVDVLEITKKYITEGKLDPIKDIIYPDFPTGGVLVKTDSEVAKIMATGRGKLKIRANVEILGNEIIVKEVPYGKTVEGIVDQIKDSDIKEIKSVMNTMGNNSNGLITIVCRSKRVVEWVLLELYRRNILQNYFASNILVINDGKPYIYGVHKIVEEWHKFRKSVIVKKFKNELEGIKEELEILDYFIRLISNNEWRDTYVVKATKVSKAEADRYLHEIFQDIPDNVCTWINGRAISAFNNGGRYLNRYQDLSDYQVYCKDMLEHPDKYIVEELNELIKKNKGTAQGSRKTFISSTDYKFSKIVEAENIEDDSPCTYTLTKDGFLFKTREGYGINEDAIMWQFRGQANSVLVGFDNYGRVLRLSGTDVPFTLPNSNGLYLPKVFDATFETSYKILYMGICDGKKLMLVYRDGYVGFIDTSEWLDKKVVKISSKGVCLAVMDKLLEVYEEEDFPQCLILADDTGKNIKLGVVKTEDIPMRGRQSRAKIFGGTHIDTKYIKGCSYFELVKYLKNPDRYFNKLVVAEDDAFIGDIEEMADGTYLEYNIEVD